MTNGREHPPIWDGEPELTNCSAPLPSDALGRIAMFVLGFICGAVAVLAILFLAFDARAETLKPVVRMQVDGWCFEAEAFAKNLKDRYGETVTQIGQRVNGEQVLVFQNTEAGTFTIGLVSDGYVCALVSGERWDMPGLTALRGEGL